MKKQLKAFGSICLSLILFFAIIPVVAYAAAPEVDYNGEGVWSPASGSVKVTISGDGSSLWIIIKNNTSESVDICHDGTYYTSITLQGHSFLPSGSVLKTWGFGNYGDTVTVYWTTDGTTIDFSLTAPPTPPTDPTLSDSSNSTHIHSFKWQTIVAPTKEADGIEGELCSCGAMRNEQPLSAYVYALNDYATPMVNAAKSGQTITFEFGEWNSFPKSFMAKLVDKSAQNVTFVFHYKWDHVKQEITIPAGTPIDLNFDWYGPAKMAELYGAN